MQAKEVEIKSIGRFFNSGNRKKIYPFLLGALIVSSLMGNAQTDIKKDSSLPSCCVSNAPSRFAFAKVSYTIPATAQATAPALKGMVHIKGGAYEMGADSEDASPDEYPKHKVKVKSFWMDETEVTNGQFAAFVKATGYVTTAEKAPDWEELKKQVPEGTPKPPDSVLVAASLVFYSPQEDVGLNDYSQWWSWQKGASWRHPEGPNSTIKGKENYPVVHVSWDDAQAYAKWAGKRLPTEAEWEWAARGGLENNIYPWGNEGLDSGRVKANTWQGIFPKSNLVTDGFYKAAPVKSFAPNNYGLYEMAGNVWEWVADFYDSKYYATVNNPDAVTDPKGPDKGFDPQDPFAQKRVIRGGSFLCNQSYCTGYRVSRRMKSTGDSSMEHLGFRCVKDE